MTLRSTCWAWCLLTLLGQRFVVGQSGNCTRGLSNSVDWQNEDSQYYLAVQPGSRLGYQVIIPGMQFNCHGFIQSWSALTILDFRFIVLAHHIYFQLWRPTGDGSYKRVDDDYLEFRPQEVNGAYRPMSAQDPDIGFLRFTGKVGEGENRMYFQPGDVVGYFIPHFSQTNIPPLSVTFVNASSEADSASLVVDMYSIASASQLCDMSECGDMVNLHSGVVPHISVQYEAIQPNTTTADPVTRYCSSTTFADCRVPTATTVAVANPTSTTSSTTPSTTSSTTPPTTTSLAASPGSPLSMTAIIVLAIAVPVLVILTVVVLVQAVVLIKCAHSKQRVGKLCKRGDALGMRENEYGTNTQTQHIATAANEAYGQVGSISVAQDVSYTQAAVNILPVQKKACGSVSGATVNTETKEQFDEEYIAVQSDHETYD